MLLKQAAGIAKGAGAPSKETVGRVTRAQVEEIAKTKMQDLNARDLDHAARIIEGTARSMGLEVAEAAPAASEPAASLGVERKGGEG